MPEELSDNAHLVVVRQPAGLHTPDVSRRVLSALRKPEYAFRPSQLIRRVLLARNRSAARKTLAKLPWGHQLTVDSHDVIGSAVLRLGVYDLLVVEALWRLTDPGETVLDVGANIGMMTSALAVRAGPHGRVHAFEPHPAICQKLRNNVALWGSQNVLVHEVAVSDVCGWLTLTVPEQHKGNAGTATLRDVVGESIRVKAASLDELIGTEERLGVAKIDVEGVELQVLRGAIRLIPSLRDVVYEAHDGYPNEVSSELEARGFTVFGLRRGFWKPTLTSPLEVSPGFDAVSLLATRDPDRARSRFSRFGWHSLRSSPYD